MFSKVSQYFYNPTCLCCGSYFVEDHLFCTYCFEKKIGSRLELKRNILPIGISPYSIFDWKPGESDLLSELVYRMKSDRCLKAWNFYGRLAIKALKYEADLSQIDYVIPIPGSKKSSVHGAIFSQIAADFLQKPMLDILVKTADVSEFKEQKEKTLVERKQSTIQLCEHITESGYGSQIIGRKILVVDDIVTTGSSFKQALDLLAGSQESLFLTLFYRTKNY